MPFSCSWAEAAPGACLTLLRLPMRPLRAAREQAGHAGEGHAEAEPEQAAHPALPGFPILSSTPPCTSMPISAIHPRPASRPAKSSSEIAAKNNCGDDRAVLARHSINVRLTLGPEVCLGHCHCSPFCTGNAKLQRSGYSYGVMYAR